MNYLAHIYLSGENIHQQIGNFIGDAVKGSQYRDYPKDIKRGILLHRTIDSFTDTHEITRNSKNRLNNVYSHYKGVLTDIYYDHFLAKNWSDYSCIDYKSYVLTFYQNLQNNLPDLPDRIQYMAPLLIKYDWFEKYQSLEGIERVLQGMERRINHIVPLSQGIRDLEVHYHDLEQDFNNFFPLLMKHVKVKELELIQV